MTKENKFKIRFVVLALLLVLSFGVWISTLVNGNKASIVFLSMLPLIAVAIAFRITKEQYDKQGLYTKRQAMAFYRTCIRNGLETIEKAEEPLWRPLYNETVGALPYENLKDNIKQAKRVFTSGKEYEERKQEKL